MALRWQRQSLPHQGGIWNMPQRVQHHPPNFMGNRGPFGGRGLFQNRGAPISPRPNPLRSPFANLGAMNNPGMQQGMQSGSGRTGSGLLSRLFNRGQTTQLTSPVNPFQFGSTASNLAGQSTAGTGLNIDTISRFLGQTQQVIRTAQQVGPMIQQYGPIIRNLPALWKIFRSMNTDEETEEKSEEIEGEELELEEENEEVEKENTDDEKKESKEKKVKKKTSKQKEHTEKRKSLSNNKNSKEKQTRESTPKLYI